MKANEDHALKLDFKWMNIHFNQYITCIDYCHDAFVLTMKLVFFMCHIWTFLHFYELGTIDLVPIHFNHGQETHEHSSLIYTFVILEKS